MKCSCLQPFADSPLTRIRSRVIDLQLAKYRRLYSVPDSIRMRAPDRKDSVLSPRPKEFAFYLDFFVARFRFPFPEEAKKILKFLSLAPCQLDPNGWRFLLGFIYLWRERFPDGPSLTPQEFLHFYRLCELEGQDGRWFFGNRGSKFPFSDHPSSDKGWKENFFFVSGVGWCGAPDVKNSKSIYNT